MQTERELQLHKELELMEEAKDQYIKSERQNPKNTERNCQGRRTQ